MGRKQYFVYIISNQRHTVFYTGVTNDLGRRVWEHKNRIVAGFTRKYNIGKLLYYEVYDSPLLAIEREKQIKDYRREKKFTLIGSLNPRWEDLSILRDFSSRRSSK